MRLFFLHSVPFCSKMSYLHICISKSQCHFLYSCVMVMFSVPATVKCFPGLVSLSISISTLCFLSLWTAFVCLYSFELLLLLFLLILSSSVFVIHFLLITHLLTWYHVNRHYYEQRRREKNFVQKSSGPVLQDCFIYCCFCLLLWWHEYSPFFFTTDWI